MADQSAKNFPTAGTFVSLLLLASMMLFGFVTYLAWSQENPWPTSMQLQSGRLFTPPAPKAPRVGPAILFGEPPIPQPNRQASEL
jgi:hypothetical protein